MQIFRYSDAVCNFLALRDTFFFRGKFSHDCHVNRCFKYHKYSCTTIPNFAIFCYDYFENLLAPITFAKKFQLSSWCSFQTIRD